MYTAPMRSTTSAFTDANQRPYRIAYALAAARKFGDSLSRLSRDAMEAASHVNRAGRIHRKGRDARPIEIQPGKETGVTLR